MAWAEPTLSATPRMAYQSLYRKYRPQTFEDVVGQGHVTRTLQNALESGRVGHGYLFTGTRGTAKTTVARLLAKALNCESTGTPVREPCNRCPACLSITAGSAIDVIEMDAASHRGVADIEEVRKSVSYGPMELRYKVFIIDEAHQLSSDAKDAFLKTLEEPPANVVFILATTEPQSIPITIRSRCQQFDFKRGSLSDITGRLRYVLDQEAVTYAPDALAHVARGAEGSYRDSLSLLEQVLAFAPTHVSTADVNLVLGTLDNEMLGRVTSAIARRDAPATFALAGELLDAGKEARTLLRTLSLHFRDLLLVSVGGPAVVQELTPEEIAPLRAEAQAFQPSEMIRAMDLLNEAQGETRWNNQHRLLVELTFLRLMNLGEAAPSNFATAPIVFQAPTMATPAAPRYPTTAAEPPARAAEPAPVAVATATPAPTPPSATEPLPVSYFADDRAIDDDENDEPEDTLTPSLFEEATEAVPLAAGLAARPAPHAAPVVVAPAPAPAPPPAEDPDEAGETFTLDDVFRVWPDFLRKSGSVSKMTETMMLQAGPTEVRGNIVEIAFRARSPFDMMNQTKGQDFVKKALRHCLGVPRVGVQFVLDETDAPPPPKPGPAKKKRERDPFAELDALQPGPMPTNSFGVPTNSFGVPTSTLGVPTNSFGATTNTLDAPTNVSSGSADTFGEASNGTTTRANKVREESPAPSRAYSLQPEPKTVLPAAEYPTPMAYEEPARSHAEKNAVALNNPLVQEVLSTFGGEIVNE
jgi:DNA polymerase-3 subunit gamma/tau